MRIWSDMIGLNRIQNMLRDSGTRLGDKLKMFLQKVGEVGYDVASVRFAEAIYAGTNDVLVDIEWQSDDTMVLVARGKAVAFIEFGTGTKTYPDNYPADKKPPGIVPRGEFGYKLGRLQSWRYRGDPGNAGEIITSGKHEGMVETVGNPAARAMLDAGTQMRNDINKIAKEVFGL